MDNAASFLMGKFLKDPEFKGVHPQAARLFGIKISNLTKKGSKVDVDSVRFYWTKGSQCRPDRGPYLRAMMKVDGKLNRFWFYFWLSPFGKCVCSWQNTTKQYESHKKWKEGWLDNG